MFGHSKSSLAYCIVLFKFDFFFNNNFGLKKIVHKIQYVHKSVNCVFFDFSNKILYLRVSLEKIVLIFFLYMNVSFMAKYHIIFYNQKNPFFRLSKKRNGKKRFQYFNLLTAKRISRRQGNVLNPSFFIVKY